jgi:uncharacterized protein (TIGR02679 family)
MSTSPDGRLQRLLGAGPLLPLRKRLRQRFERGALDENIDRFRISNLTVEEHSVLASLLGRPVRFSSSMQVDVHAIDTALQRAGIAISLRQALEQIDGPIVHIETSRRQLEATWSGVINRCGDPGLAKFLQVPAGIGLLKRLSGRNPQAAVQLCGRADRVLQSLPASGMTRAQLAADTLGDAHALDNGQPTATIVLAVWRKLVAPLVEVEDTLPTSQDDRDVQHEIKDERVRDIWARAGVLVNELARPALFLNLSTSGNRRIVCASGEPSYASLRLLLRSPPCWTIADQDVFVCENPNLVAIAADELGEHCAPMVCTEGMPAAAQRTLLTQLVQAGARLWYHGDFDWPGLRIGNHVMREYGARPWHFGVSEYTAAVQSGPRPGHPLRGAEVLASWDEALSAMMRAHQLAIAEESVAASLLQDLDG